MNAGTTKQTGIRGTSGSAAFDPYSTYSLPSSSSFPPVFFNLLFWCVMQEIIAL